MVKLCYNKLAMEITSEILDILLSLLYNFKTQTSYFDLLFSPLSNASISVINIYNKSQLNKIV